MTMHTHTHTRRALIGQRGRHAAQMQLGLLIHAHLCRQRSVYHHKNFKCVYDAGLVSNKYFQNKVFAVTVAVCKIRTLFELFTSIKMFLFVFFA